MFFTTKTIALKKIKPLFDFVSFTPADHQQLEQLTVWRWYFPKYTHKKINKKLSLWCICTVVNHIWVHMQANPNLNYQLMMDHWFGPHQSLDKLLHLPNKRDYLKKQALE